MIAKFNLYIYKLGLLKSKSLKLEIQIEKEKKDRQKTKSESQFTVAKRRCPASKM